MQHLEDLSLTLAALRAKVYGTVCYLLQGTMGQSSKNGEREGTDREGGREVRTPAHQDVGL